MRIGFALASSGLVALLACGGNGGSVSVSGTDPASIRSAPAGAAVLTFLDLELLRPDQIQGGNPPAGVTLGSAGASSTFTYNTVSASGGTLTGTVTVSGGPAFIETFNLASTTTLAGGAAQTWTYTGSQKVTLAGGSANVVLADAAAPIRAVFTDSSNPANNKTYSFTPNLAADLGNPSGSAMSGSYQLAGANGAIISCDIAPGAPLAFIRSGPGACSYPSSGTLTLSLTSPGGNDEVTAAFNAGCGNVTLGGKTISLGGN